MLGEDEAADAGANDQDGGVVHHGIIVAQGRVKAWIGWFALCGGWLFFWRHPCPGEWGGVMSCLGRCLFYRTVPMTAQERHMQASPSKWSRRLGIRSAGGVAVQSQSRESLSCFVLRISRTRPARLCRDVFLCLVVSLMPL